MKDNSPSSITYQDKLKDPRWQRKRLQIIARDNATCQICFGEGLVLNVHHKKYIYGKEPWDYPSELLITLCEDCHEEEHLRSASIKERERIKKMSEKYCKEDSIRGDVWRLIRDCVEKIRLRSM